ncbi:MAG: GNAT family N-acetyltransferase [Clostridia bacterium]|nr:GNAT family N-acetyltransferase [Clostridia bacterium]
MELIIKEFDELTTRELYEIVRARTKIFLLEQGIVCQDFDRVDYGSLHCFIKEGIEVIAYLRAYRAEDGAVQIGRVLSTPHGKGLGTRLMEEAIPKIKNHFGSDKIMLHAQTHAMRFYERLGFVVASPEFDEEGIPHVTMILKQ